VRHWAALAALTLPLPLAALASGAEATAGATSPPHLSARALQAKAISDAEGAGWVHEVGQGTDGTHTYSSDNDIGTFEGRQNTKTDAAQAEVIVIGRHAYIRGNAAAISTYFGLTANDPQQLAGTWVSIVPSDAAEFQTVTAAVTLKSDFTNWSISGPLTEGGVTKVDGQRVIPLEGQVTQPTGDVVAVTLYVTDSAKPLPVQSKSVSSTGTTTTTWSRWGHRVTLTAPTGAVSFSSLFG
jgi:hypothetical protein